MADFAAKGQDLFAQAEKKLKSLGWFGNKYEEAAELLEKAPRARACIMQAIDPYSGELTDLKATCSTLRGGWVNGETGRIRDRAADALSHGCRYVKK